MLENLGGSEPPSPQHALTETKRPGGTRAPWPLSPARASMSLPVSATSLGLTEPQPGNLSNEENVKRGLVGTRQLGEGGVGLEPSKVGKLFMKIRCCRYHSPPYKEEVVLTRGSHPRLCHLCPHNSPS